jgi:hypothetical protein
MAKEIKPIVEETLTVATPKVTAPKPVEDPVYRKKVYNLLKNDFSDFYLSESDFYKKLDSDQNYAPKVYKLIRDNYSDFSKPEQDFLFLMTPSKKKDESGGIPVISMEPGGELPTQPAEQPTTAPVSSPSESPLPSGKTPRVSPTPVEVKPIKLPEEEIDLNDPLGSLYFRANPIVEKERPSDIATYGPPSLPELEEADVKRGLKQKDYEDFKTLFETDPQYGLAHLSKVTGKTEQELLATPFAQIDAYARPLNKTDEASIQMLKRVKSSQRLSDPNNWLNGKWSAERAAIAYASETDPEKANFIRQYMQPVNITKPDGTVEKTNIYGNPKEIFKDADATLGTLVFNYLNDPVNEAVAMQGPFAAEFQQAKKDLLKNYPKFAATAVANKVSQAYEKSGQRGVLSRVGQMGTPTLLAELDETAKKELTPEEYQVYSSQIKGNEEQWLDVPTVLEEFAGGIKSVFGGIRSTFTEPFTPTSETQLKAWEESASNVSADPKGFWKFANDAAHMAGFVAGMSASGGMLGGGQGLTQGLVNTTRAMSPTAMNMTNAGLVFFGDNLKAGKLKYPDDPAKAIASAGFNTALFMALAKDLFPTKQVESAIKTATPQIDAVVNQLRNGAITREVAKAKTRNILTNTIQTLSAATKQNVKASSEMAAIAALDRGLDNLMGLDKQKYDQFHGRNAELDAFTNMFMGNVGVAAWAGYGKMRYKNMAAINSYYDVASKPNLYRKVVSEGQGTPEAKAEVLENITFVETLKNELDALGMPESKQKAYIANAIGYRALVGKSSADPNIQSSNEQKANEIKADQEELLKNPEEEISFKDDGFAPIVLEIEAKPEEVKVEGEEVAEVPEAVKISEVVDRNGTYKGQKGRFYLDGQRLIFDVDNSNKEYDIGNIEEIGGTNVQDFGIKMRAEGVTVSRNEAGNLVIRGQELVNNFSDPTKAINKNEAGEVVSVNLETPDGKKRTFRGNSARDIAAEIEKGVEAPKVAAAEVPAEVAEGAPTVQPAAAQTEKTIEELRAAEQAEYAAMADPKDQAKRKEIYDKYDKLISPLLAESKPSVPQPAKTIEQQAIEQQAETEQLIGGQAENNRKAGRYEKDGVEYVRNESGQGEYSDRKGEVRFTNEVSVPFRYKLVEAETLQPSHSGGLRNPNHFIPEAQPKSRLDKGSIMAEEGFANNPRFDELGENTNAYSGAPVVNQRNEVVQGNNRAAGLKKGYERGNPAYKESLKANATKFGFSPSQVEGMKNPVLVREVATSDQGAIELGNYDVKDLETGGKRRLDPVAVTRRMSFDNKKRLAEILFGAEGTLNEAIRGNVKRVMEILNPFLNQAQRNTLMNKEGNLTEAGAKDLEAVVQQLLFDNGDPALPDLFENLTQTQKEGLRKALPHIFAAGAEKNLVKEVQNAILALNDFATSGAVDFNQWLSQTDMFKGGKTPKDLYTPLELKIAEVLNDAKSQKEIKLKFQQFEDAVKSKEATMFEAAQEGKSKDQAVKEIFEVEEAQPEAKPEPAAPKEATAPEEAPEAPRPEPEAPEVNMLDTPVTVKAKAVDLLGDLRKPWMFEVTEAELEKLSGGSSPKIRAIEKAIKNGEYEKAIEEGRMTFKDAKQIIESAQLDVPNSLKAPKLDFAAAPKPSAPKPSEPKAPQPERPVKEGVFTVEDIGSERLENDEGYNTVGYPDSFSGLYTNKTGIRNQNKNQVPKVGDVVTFNGERYVVKNIIDGEKFGLIRIDKDGNLIRNKDLKKQRKKEIDEVKDIKDGEELKLETADGRRVTGKKVTLPGYEDIDFVVVKDGLNYDLYELSSGLRINKESFFSEKEAISSSAADLAASNATSEKILGKIYRNTTQSAGKESSAARKRNPSPAYDRFEKKQKVKMSEAEEKILIPKEIIDIANEAEKKGLTDAAEIILGGARIGGMTEERAREIIKNYEEREAKKDAEKNQVPYPKNLIEKRDDSEKAFAKEVNEGYGTDRYSLIPDELKKKLYDGFKKEIEIFNKYGYYPNSAKEGLTNNSVIEAGRYLIAARAKKMETRGERVAEQEKDIDNYVTEINKLYEREIKAEGTRGGAEVGGKPTEAKAGPTGEVPTKGRFESEAEKFAEDVIMKFELPSWLKGAKLPPGTEKMGPSLPSEEAIKKALANAVIKMGKLLDRGVEFSQAVKEATRNLVKMFGEDQAQEIQKNFTNYYNDAISKQTAGKVPVQPKAGAGEKVEGGVPGAEPKKPAQEKAEDKGEKKEVTIERKKAFLNAIINAKGTPKEAKEGLEKKGLTYKTSSQKEAAEVAESIIESQGIDAAVEFAEKETLDGDVNALVMMKALEKLSDLEAEATSPAEKRKYAIRFAEIAEQFDNKARSKGRFNSAISFFYKKSPLGVVINENNKRKQRFDEWSEGKENSWENFYESIEEMLKDPAVAKIINERIAEGIQAGMPKAKAGDSLRKFASVIRKGRISKLGGFKAGTGFDAVWDASLEVIAKSVEGGAKLVDAIEAGLNYVRSTNWYANLSNKSEFEDKYKEHIKSEYLTAEANQRKAERYLDRLKKRLSGLSAKERDKVVKKTFIKIVESGGLDYQEFRDIIGEVTGRGRLTDAQAERMEELVKKTNSVEIAAKRVQDERTPESLKAYKIAELEAAKATAELQELLDTNPNVWDRLTSIMQLNTLGIPALINNPIYNIWNQATVRFPVGVVNTFLDQATAKAFKAVGGNYVPESNVLNAQVQAEFFKKLGFGGKEALTQFVTGLNRQDYIQKELTTQKIKPIESLKSLYRSFTGKEKLTKAQKLDKILQGTVGLPAEIVARTLNLGDKPQRFAAEAATASMFAKTLGLKDLDYRIFVEFPEQEAYRALINQGVSPAEAKQRAQYIKESIIQEGKRSTFQQDNILNNILNSIFSNQNFGGAGNLIKSVAISPYIKIPANAYWSYYNMVNPEIALLQSMVYGAKAAKTKGVESKKAAREARYWFGHAAVGVATRAVVLALVQQGVFNPGTDQQETKKEREGKSTFIKQGTIDIDKLAAALRGQNPDEVKGGTLVPLKYMGHWGTIGNTIAKQYEEMTPEQRKAKLRFWDAAIGGLEREAVQELQEGIFANTSALLSALQDDRSMRRYGLNVINLFTNIIQPAAAAQLERATLDYQSSAKADNFMQEIKNSMLQRSWGLRKILGEAPPAKIGIWGDVLDRKENFMMRWFGISKENKDNFSYPIWELVKKTGDIGYLPPAVLPKLNDQELTVEQTNKLQELVGNARKARIAPYINNQAEIEGFTDADGNPIKFKDLASDEDKKFVLNYLYTLGREDGLYQFYLDYPQLNPYDEPKTEGDFEKEARKNYFRMSNFYKERSEDQIKNMQERRMLK